MDAFRNKLAEVNERQTKLLKEVVLMFKEFDQFKTSHPWNHFEEKELPPRMNAILYDATKNIQDQFSALVEYRLEWWDKEPSDG